MIALVGQSVIDRVKLPGRPPVERLGGAPLFAGQALAMARTPAVILTRGGPRALRQPLHDLGLPVIEGPPGPACVSDMEVYEDGTCSDGFAAFGEPFSPADVAGWMGPGLDRADLVVCGAQWEDDFPRDTLAALAAGGRPVYLDGQGPLRLRRLGPLRLEGRLTPELLRDVTVLKFSEEEATAALGGITREAPRMLGVPIVIVTRGVRGAVLLAGEAAIEVGVQPVVGLADAIGAGDAFLALLARARAEGARFVEATHAACAGVAALLRRRLELSRRAVPA